MIPLPTPNTVAAVDILNIVQTIATIASASKFGETYARCKAAQFANQRAGVVTEDALPLTGARNYYLAVHRFDRKVRV